MLSPFFLHPLQPLNVLITCQKQIKFTRYTGKTFFFTLLSLPQPTEIKEHVAVFFLFLFLTFSSLLQHLHSPLASCVDSHRDVESDKVNHTNIYYKHKLIDKRVTTHLKANVICYGKLFHARILLLLLIFFTQCNPLSLLLVMLMQQLVHRSPYTYSAYCTHFFSLFLRQLKHSHTSCWDAFEKLILPVRSIAIHSHHLPEHPVNNDTFFSRFSPLTHSHSFFVFHSNTWLHCSLLSRWTSECRQLQSLECANVRLLLSTCY